MNTRWFRVSVLPLALALTTAGAADDRKRPAGTPKPQQVDESPTAYACSVETLLSGAECYFEANKPPPDINAKAQTDDNRDMVRQIAATACTKSAKAELGRPVDATALALCKRKFTEIAADCDLDGQPLLDSQARFHPNAGECYQALSTVLSETRSATLTSPSCCQCLATSACGVSADTCYQKLLKNRAEGAWNKCIATSCQSECATFAVPVRPEDPALHVPKQPVKKSQGGLL